MYLDQFLSLYAASHMYFSVLPHVVLSLSWEVFCLYYEGYIWPLMPLFVKSHIIRDNSTVVKVFQSCPQLKTDDTISRLCIWPHTGISTHMHQAEHTFPIPSTGVIVCNLCIMQLLWDAALPWCLSCFGWIYFVLFCFILMFVSLLPAAINQGLCFAPGSDSSALLLYLFVFWWGSCRPTFVCWEGILISCNFPALTWIGVKCGKQQEDTDVDSSSDKWRMGVKLTPGFDGFYVAFHIKCQVAYISGGQV